MKVKLSRLNLSRRIALLVAILIIIVTIGIGLTGYKFSSNVVIDQTEEALLEIAEGVGTEGQVPCPNQSS